MLSQKEKVLMLLRNHDALRPMEMAHLLKVSTTTVHTTLRELLTEGYLIRSGSRPQVLYRLATDISESIQKSFLYKTNLGGVLFGMEGFKEWVKEKFDKYSFAEKVTAYEKAYTEYCKERKGGFLLEAKIMAVATLPSFDSLRCLDLYNLKIENEQKRTKEAVLLEVGKGDGSPKKLETLLGDYISSSISDINEFIKKNKIDAVAFVPPTKKRKVQVMRLLEKEFERWNVYKIKCIAIKRHFENSSLPRQEQKNISSVKGRIENAKATYHVVNLGTTYKKVLLVDDLVGSGATMNEVVRKLKESGTTKEVHCLGLVGINTKKLVVERVL